MKYTFNAIFNITFYTLLLIFNIKNGDSKSLNSLALLEPELSLIVKITEQKPSIDAKHLVSLPNFKGERRLPLVTIPHYLTFRLFDLLSDI